MSERYRTEEREYYSAYGVPEGHFGCDDRIERAALAGRLRHDLHVKTRVRNVRKGSAADSEREALKREIAELRAALANLTAVLRVHIEQTSYASVTVSPVTIPDLGGLTSRYEMPAQDEIRAHLAKRPHLRDVFVDAADELRRRFGQTKLMLLARDDERLVVALDTDLEVDEAEKRLALFRREWWQLKIDVEDRTAVKLHFI